MPTYTTPVDVVTDELVTAARFNAQVMEDIRFLYSPPCCSLTCVGGTESIANNTSTDIPFDVEAYDTDAMHSTVTNNDRVIITTAGKYLVTANVNWAANAAGRRYCAIKKNGVAIAQMNSAPVATTGEVGQAIVAAAAAAATDYFELEVYQNSGGALDSTPSLQVTWVAGS